ncbi:TSUP family transporter [Deinococcus sp. QL22]|uniref:TSUP family transporter n=1 Tax=Deinococcus sp. QL22 TaxID=2939437 RepID=UPI002113937A|nr:TSUP family transporter [Deinococcus sp. QL22]
MSAVIQGVAGMGFALLCAPFLIQVFGPTEGVKQVVLLSLVLNAVYFGREVKGARLKDALSLLLPSLLVAPLLASWFRKFSPDVLLVIAGTITIISAILLAFGVRTTQLEGRAGALGAGVMSAAMNVAGGLSGPAVAMYAVSARWPVTSIRPTLQLFGIGVNTVTLLSLGSPNMQHLPWIGLMLGVVGGFILAPKISSERIRPLILSLAFIGGGWIVLKGLW